MKPDDIIGKKFTCFEFVPLDTLIRFDDRYKSFIGNTAVVTDINSSHPQYASARVSIPNGGTCNLHYPTQMIIDKIESESKSIEDLLNEVKHLTSQLWKTKI